MDFSNVIGDVLNAFGYILTILGSQTCNGNTTVLRHVNVMLLNHGVALGRCQSREGEHTDLVCDVVPGALCSNFLESRSKQLSHLRNAVSNCDQLVKPLLSEAEVVQDGGGDSGTVGRWRRIIRSNDNLHLGEHSGCGILVVAHEVECAGTLTVQAHDFGEGLGDDHLESLAHEVSEALTVLIEVTSHEALVGSVEEWIQ